MSYAYNYHTRRSERTNTYHTNNPRRGMSNSQSILPHVSAQYATPNITEEQRAALQSNRDQYIADLSFKIVGAQQQQRRFQAGTRDFARYRAHRLQTQASNLYERSVGGAHMPGHGGWLQYYRDLAWRRAIVPQNTRSYNIIYG